jgi:hypothetical protein
MPYSPEKAREYYLRNKERVKSRVAEYREKNPEKAKAAVLAWYAKPENKAKRNEYFKTYSKTEPFIRAQLRYKAKPGSRIKRRDNSARWRDNNVDGDRAKSARYRQSLRARTPSWLTPDDSWLIEEIYELAALRSKLTGVSHDVDHIIPLKGRLVSGLHTPTNLQVIASRDNVKKGTKYLIS